MALNDLTGIIQEGQNFARPSLFEVSCDDIPMLGMNDAVSENGDYAFLVKAAAIPASTLSSIELPSFGRKVRIPSTRTFEPWQITVIYGKSSGTDGTDIRAKFEKWMEEIQGYEEHTVAGTGLLDNWTISLQDPRDITSTPLIEVKMYGCFPTELGSVELNQESSDTLAEFTVSMQYTYHDGGDQGSINNPQ